MREFLEHRSLFTIALTCTVFFFVLAPRYAFSVDTATCEATDRHPVVICFKNPPLTVDHCSGSVVPNFLVNRKRTSDTDDAFYYFTYNLSFKNQLHPTFDPFAKLEQRYVLRSDDPTTEMKQLSLPQDSFKGDGDYTITLTVHVDGRADVTETSNVTRLHDGPVVKSILVGISEYDTPGVPRLLHADSDANTFAALLESIFPFSPHPIVLTSNKTGAFEPTKNNIIVQLQLAQDTDELCTDADWFVFYFSGHGVVDVDSQNKTAGHFVSTKSLDPSKIRSTAIEINDLLNAIYAIRAKNKLVILDSCFSGSSTPATVAVEGDGVVLNTSRLTQIPKSARRLQSGKVEYIRDHQLVDSVQPGDQNTNNLGGDSLVLDDTARREEANQRHVLYLSAADATHEAEEGYVGVEDNKLQFTPSDLETDQQKPLGHSLYTYAWTWNLLKQIPKNIALPNLPGALPSPANVHICFANFREAAEGADVFIDDLRNRHEDREYQTPEIHYSQHRPDRVRCSP